MTEHFDLRTINQFVLRKQHLVGGDPNTQLSDVLLNVGGLNANNPITPYLSLIARLPEFEPKDLAKQLFEDPTMALIRCVRRSIYVHNEKLLPVMFAATSYQAIKATEHFMIYRGVPLSEYKVLSDSILKLLEQGQLTESEITESLETEFDIAAVLDYMCDLSLILRGAPAGGWKDPNYTYVIYSDIFPDIDLRSLEEREAFLPLVRNYIEAFGPASLNDIVWWTGLGKIRVRSALRALGDEILEIRTTESNSPLLMLDVELERLRAIVPAQSPPVTILPNLDSYIMGYIDRDRYVDDNIYQYVFDDSGNATNVILVNGRVAGVWDYSVNSTSDFKVHMFDYQLASTSDLIRSRAKRLAKHLTGREVRILQVERMAPLAKQPPGTYMSPLQDMAA